METPLIKKENISKLSFPFSDVLSSSDEKHLRLEKLKTAMILGNGFKHKVKIVFRDTHLKQMVETTLWFVSEKHVTLKSGVVMPVGCIEDVIL
jgi:hypothetical protein